MASRQVNVHHGGMGVSVLVGVATHRLVRRTPPWLWGALLAGAGVAFGLVAEHLAQAQADRPDTWTLPDLAAGWAFLLAGLLVQWLRPGNRCWLLLTGVGVTWFIGTLASASGENVSMLGFAFNGASAVMLAWLLLAYPTGQLAGRAERILLVAVLTVYAVHVASRLFLFVPPDGTGCDCVANRFIPVTDRRWFDAVEDVYPWMFTAVFVLVLLAAVARWQRSSQPGRRMLLPVVASASLVAAELAYSNVVRQQIGLVVPTGRDLLFVVAGIRVVTAAAFVVGLAQLHGTRSAVVDLVGELPGQGAAPDRLAEALRRALGDPSLTLAPWSEEAGAFVDGNGHRVSTETQVAGRATTFISDHDRPLAALVHDEALLADSGLVSAVTAAVRLTSDNERLRTELERQLVEVAASRARIVAAGDAERSRIERDLHDGAQQRLVTIALALRLAEARLPENGDLGARAAIEQAIKDLGEAIDELRDLARGIHPAVLTESGLAVALESLTDRSPSPVRLQLAPFPEPPAAVAIAAYYLIAECLTNVAKHAQASAVTVCVRPERSGLLVEVSDDGRGSAITTPGGGLDGLGDRVAALGGTLSVDSKPGAGTRVRAWLPCA
jgi:signal transduction histidine kinase